MLRYLTVDPVPRSGSGFDRTRRKLASGKHIAEVSFDANYPQYSWQHIYQTHPLTHSHPRELTARIANDQGHVHLLLIQRVAVLQGAVLVEGLSVVRHQNDHSILEASRASQQLDESREAPISIEKLGIVEVDEVLDILI